MGNLSLTPSCSRYQRQSQLQLFCQYDVGRGSRGNMLCHSVTELGEIKSRK